MKRTGLSIERHKQVGKTLRETIQLIEKLRCEVYNAYGQGDFGRNGKASASLGFSLRNLEKARSEMEEILFKEHPEEANTNFYYGSLKNEENNDLVTDEVTGNR